MARAAAFYAELGVFIDRNLSPAAQSAALAAAAKAKADELIRTGRAQAPFRRFVDGREGAPEESVKPAPSGRIIYEFNTLGAVCTFALSFLVNRSPTASSVPVDQKTGKTGRYRDSFYLGLDGRFVPMKDFNPQKLGAVAQIVIGNTQPYSRKLDVQLAGGKRLRFSVPAGLFEDAAKAIQRRYGALVEVKRVYTMSFPGQYKLRNNAVYKRGARKGMPREGRVQSPAIIITPRR